MNKKRATYNISNSILEKFEEFTSKTASNKSRLVELLISEWIENQNKIIDGKKN